ncbi:MAG: NAD(P)-binding domain-containing protein [Polyangiaceae bacterium]
MAAPAPLLAPAARVRLPQIDVNTCIGCYACVDACPYDVLEIERYVAKVARPEACCGLTLCEQRCPNGSLRITDGEPIGERPRLTEALESPDMPGLFLAGDVTGLPLIKNAIHQGALAVRGVQRSLEQAGERRGDGALDLLVVGAGPAGISAALEAKSLGLTFEVVEQGSVAQSIQSFPRGKLVFDQPLELPVAGKLWLRESSKEELLVQWMRVVRQERLPIRQDTRMLGLRREGGLFRVTVAPRGGGAPAEILARRVVLSIGQRGQPRRLPFELGAEVVSRVHYHLADARSFAGQRVLVVGLGDVAMEAAAALARQPGTTVTVAYRGNGFRRGKTRNIEELNRLVEAGRATRLFDTEVEDIRPDGALLRGRSGSQRLPCDAVLVLIGNIPPWSTLREVGVRLHAEAPLPAPAAPPDEIELQNAP